MSNPYPFPEGDSRHLDAIDDLLGGLNLASILVGLAPLAVFTDPIFGMPALGSESDGNGQTPVSLAATWRSRLHLWHVLYFAMVALEKSNPYRRANLSQRDLTEIVDHFNSYDMPLSEVENNPLAQALTRLAYQQFPYQRAWWAGMTGAQFIYEQSEPTKGYCIKDAVGDTFGMQYSDLLDICADIYYIFHNQVRTNRPATFTLKSLSNWLPWVPQGSLARVIGAISQTQEDFRRERQSTAQENPALRKFDYNPLLARPLVQIGREYYAPAPSLILLWATQGIAYRLSDCARNEEKDGHFGKAFGRAFEDYVDSILRASGRSYIRECTIRVGKQRCKTADFILVEGNRALIFDCKTRRATVKHRCGVLDAIERDYEEIVKGLKQTMQTEKWIRDGILSLSAHPELAGVTNFSPAVVTYGDYYLANSALMRRSVADRLGTTMDYCVFSGRELELMLKNIGEGQLIPFINTKTSHTNDMDQDQLLIPSLFEDYLRHQLTEQGAKLIDPCAEINRNILIKLKNRVTSIQ